MSFKLPLKKLTLSAIAVLMLAACSHIGLAYRNLDVIIPWSLSDYLNMNRAQKSLFNDRLDENLRWHCTTQLPLYLTWLDKVRAMAVSGRATDEQLQALTVDAKQAVTAIAKEITPSTVELLQELDDSQVADLQQSLAKDMQDRRDKFLAPPLDEQISERADRMEKRLTPWLGKLSDQQERRVQQWSASLGTQNTEWLANRANWQQQFITAVQQRHTADFPQRIARLLQDRESFWTPRYHQVYADTERAARQLLIDLLQESTPQQRQQLVNKIDEVHREFTALDCLKGVSTATQALQ